MRLTNKLGNSTFFTPIGIASTARSYKKTLLPNYPIIVELRINPTYL